MRLLSYRSTATGWPAHHRPRGRIDRYRLDAEDLGVPQGEGLDAARPFLDEPPIKVADIVFERLLPPLARSSASASITAAGRYDDPADAAYPSVFARSIVLHRARGR